MMPGKFQTKVTIKGYVERLMVVQKLRFVHNLNFSIVFLRKVNRFHKYCIEQKLSLCHALLPFPSISYDLGYYVSVHALKNRPFSFNGTYPVGPCICKCCLIQLYFFRWYYGPH